MSEKKTNLQKWDVRLSFLTLREKIPLERRKEAEKRLFETLSEILIPYSVVLSFCSTRDEINTHQINDWILKNKKLALTRVEADQIIPCLVNDLNQDLEVSKWKILEPKNSCPKLGLNEIDCVLVPGVCFDSFHHRIGFGKGYYDRFLTQLKADTIGIGYKEQQYHGVIPKQQHDIALKKVLLF